MRHNKFTKILAIIMILAISCVFLFACADEKEPEPTPPTPPTPPAPTETVDTARAEVVKAIANSFEFDASKAVGFDYSLTIPGDKTYTLVLKGYLDTVNATTSKMFLGLNEGNNLIFNLSADDEYMYIETANDKRRITGLHMADVLKDAKLPTTDEVNGSLFGAIPGIVLDIIFVNPDYTKAVDGAVTTTTLNGDLVAVGDLLGDMLEGVNAEVANIVKDVLGKIDMTAVAKMSNEKIDAFDLTVRFDGKPLNVKFASKFGNYEPEILVPAKNAEGFIESKLLNFTIDGKLDMTKTNGYIDNTITTYNYELKVNLDLFAMLRNALSKNAEGKVVFDATKLFNVADTTDSIYFNLSHMCNESCGCNKVEKANGSILTFAYAPKDFGNNEFYISVRPMAIVPQEVVDLLGATGGSAIASVLKGQWGTNLNPEALFANINSDEAVAMAGEENATAVEFPTNINFIAIINKVVDFLGEFRLDKVDGLRVGTDALVDILYELNPVIEEAIGEDVASMVSIPKLVKAFFGEASHMFIDVDSAVYGAQDIESINYYEQFMILDESVGEYKFGGSNPGPVMNMEWVRDVNGNVVLGTEAKIDMYEIVVNEEGVKEYKPLPLSKAEYDIIFASPISAKYTYETVSGAKGEGATIISNHSAIDFSKVGTQKVTFTTLPADNNGIGSFGYLFTLLKMMNIDLGVQAEIFENDLVIAPDITKVEFSQPDNAKYDPEKTYNFNESIKTAFNVTMTYGEGENALTKVHTGVAPVTGSYSSIKTFEDKVVLDYEYLGYTHSITIKTAAPTLTEAGITAEKVTIETDKEWDGFISKPVKFRIEGATRDTSWYISSQVKSDIAKFVCPEGVEVYVIKNDEGNFSKYGVKFAKAGTYTITMNVLGASKDFVFTVNEAPKPAPVPPAFAVAGMKYSKGVATITMGRGNQYGDAPVLANVKVEAMTKKKVETKVTLAYGTDYDIKVDGVLLDANAITLKLMQAKPQIVEIVMKDAKYSTMAIKVTFNATDFDNAVLCDKNSGYGWED